MVVLQLNAATLFSTATYHLVVVLSLVGQIVRVRRINLILDVGASVTLAVLLGEDTGLGCDPPVIRATCHSFLE